MLILLAVFIKCIWYFLKCVKSSLTYFMSPSRLPGAVLGAKAVKRNPRALVLAQEGTVTWERLTGGGTIPVHYCQDLGSGQIPSGR